MVLVAISCVSATVNPGKAVAPASADTTKPKVSAFDVQPRSIADGASVSATYTVQDSGGSGLKQVELWRKKDNGTWAGVQTKSLSGNGPVSGSFSDKPSPSGTYYYGIHVVDNAGNYDTEGSLGAKTVVVSARVPSVSSISGTKWPPAGFTYSDPSYNNYYQVPYDKCSPSTPCSAIPFYVDGSNLDAVTTVDVSAPGYSKSVSIVSKSSTRLTLDIRAIANGWSDTSPMPVKQPTLTFYYSASSTVTKQIDTGIIPVFYVNNQAWGQCTWYAGIIMRNRNGQTPVTSYSSTVALSGNPNDNGFPKKGSVLNASDKHMAYLDDITTTSTITNSDGSTSTTYKLTYSDYNYDYKCGKRTNQTTTMTVQKSRDGQYKITSLPKAGYTVTKVKQ
jgi:hypothetical protein